jgi:hypothetical protein
MILYVNGTTHTMAAEAANSCIAAKDDPALAHLGDLPHPANMAVSWGKLLSLALRAGFQCDASPNNTVNTIITTASEWIEHQQDSIVIIEWNVSTQEEESNVWQFHQVLRNRNVKHIFFNGSVPLSNQSYDWDFSYISPLGEDGTYERRLQLAGFMTVSPSSKHYARDGHAYWNRFLINYIISQNFV